MDFLQLPNEVVYNIFKYIDIEILESYLSVPQLNKFIVNYLYPIAEINERSKFRLVKEFNRFCKKFNYEYFPRSIISNTFVPCSNLKLISNEENYQFENITSLKLTCKVKDKLPSSVKKLEIKFDNYNLIAPGLEELCIEGCILNYLEYLPSSIYKLTIIDFIGVELKLPRNIIDLEITELSNSINIIHDNNVKRLRYKGNLHTNSFQYLLQVNLDRQLVESLTLARLNLISLSQIDEYESLKELEIIECPNINVFTDLLPHNLEKLTYKLTSHIPSVNFNLKVQEYTIVAKLKLPPSLKSLVIQNHPLLKLDSCISLPPTLKVLNISNTGGFSGNMNNLKLPSTLYKITLINLGLDKLPDLPSSLIYLDVSKNRLRTITLKSLKYLQCLNLSRNLISDISSIPSSLEFLKLNNNPIHKLDSLSPLFKVQFSTDLLFEIPNVRNLEISLSITSFNNNLPNNLESLYIHNKLNKLINYSNSFFQFPLNLTRLTLINTNIPSDVLFYFPITIEEVTIHGNWSQKSLNLFLDSIEKCTRLISVNLSGGNVEVVNVDRMPNTIEYLMFKNMGLKFIIGIFPTSLYSLNLEMNYIQSLNVPNVTYLNLEKNRLENLNHFDFKNCVELKELKLSLNPLTESTIDKLIPLTL
ncbi:unnamed protein product [Candida verbasci]|uniref:Uncharacterized protein n=1 Tax=Candida verbasci TaxID=1227364 RepID=A0A9W4X9L1_9ASCO|nr:unnamed protein product [Candida verbasci]